MLLTRRHWLLSVCSSLFSQSVFTSANAGVLQFHVGDGTLSFTLRRPADQLALRFTLSNSEFKEPFFGRPIFRRLDKTKPIVAVVEFPPQSINEQTFFESSAHEP